MTSPHDNGPIIGELDLAKERRWAEERAACWARFRTAGEYILRAPPVREPALLARYRARHGEWAALSLADWVTRQRHERHLPAATGNWPGETDPG